MNFVRNLNATPIWRESISNLAWYHRAYLVDCKLLFDSTADLVTYLFLAVV